MSPHPVPYPEPNRQAMFVASLIGVGAFAALAALAFPGQPAQPAISAAVPAAPVRVVGGAAFSGDCAEQTWPHIAPHCITRAAEPSAPAKPAAGGSGSALATPIPESQSSAAPNDPAPALTAQGTSAVERSAAVPGSPPPPGAEPRRAGDIPDGSQAQAVAPGAATAAIAGAGAAAAMPNLVGGESQAKPRSERRRRAVRIHRSQRFNFRISGFRF